MASIPQPHDAELVNSALSGNRHSFDQIVERYFGLVYAVAYSRLRHRESAEDLAQEVFLRAYLNLDKVQQPELIAGWLVRVAQHLAVDWIRQGNRRSKLIPMVAIDDIVTDIPDKEVKNGREIMINLEQNEALQSALFNLPENQREMVLLHYAEGYSHRQIAKYLSIHPSNVGRQLRKALKSMQTSMTPILEETAPSFRAPRKVMLRTLAVISATAALTAQSKAALVTAAAGTSWIPVVVKSSAPGVIKSIWNILFSKQTLGLVGKGMVIIAIGGGVYFGVTKYLNHNPKPGTDSSASTRNRRRAFATAQSPNVNSIPPIASQNRIPGVAVQKEPLPNDNAIAALDTTDQDNGLSNTTATKDTESTKPNNASIISHPAPGSRTFHFPASRSLGRVKIMGYRPLEYYLSEIPNYLYYHNNWDIVGEATGDIIIPPNKISRLDITGIAADDLSPLLNLKPDDLDILILNSNNHIAKNNRLQYLRNLTGLKQLTIGTGNLVSSSDLQALKNFTALKILTVNADNLDNTGLELIAQLKSVEVLSIYGKQYTDAGLKSLTKLPALRELAIWINNLDGSGLAYLKQVPTLRLLEIDGQSKSGDKLLQYLTELHSLRRLKCFGTMNITDQGLQYLSNLTDLEYLEFIKPNKITDSGLSYLKPLTKLKRLSIMDSQVTENGIPTLKEQKELEYLCLPPFNMTDKGLAYVTQFPKLKYLWMGNYSKSPISDAGIKNLEKLPMLEQLYFSGTGITDTGMSSIAKLSNLKQIGIFSVPQLTNSGFAKLTSLKRLTSIEMLANNWVSIAGINHLNSLPELDNIKVYEIVNDDAVLDLSNLKKLTRLVLYTKKSQGIKPADLLFLKKMPQLRHLYLPLDIGDNEMHCFENLAAIEYLNIGGPKLSDEGLRSLATMKKINTLFITGNITDKGIKYLEGLKSLSGLRITTAKSVSTPTIESLKRKLPNLDYVNISQNQVLQQTAKPKDLRYAPAFTAKTEDGKTLKLEDYRGKVVLLYFWATWCKPCTESMPELIKLYSELSQYKDFAMIGISLDISDEAWRNYVLINGLRWKQLRVGEKSRITADYGIDNVPAYFLIGKDGRIILDKKDDWKNLKDIISNALKL